MMGFSLKKIEEGEELSSINIEGVALDEIDLIGESISTLIIQLDLNDMCGDDSERFDREMRKILLAVADNYRNAGLLDKLNQQLESLLPIEKSGMLNNFSLSDDEPT